MKEAQRNDIRTDAGRFQQEKRRVAEADMFDNPRPQITTRQSILQSKYLRRPLFWIGSLLGVIWASPLTFAGLVFAIPIVLFHGHLQVIHGHTLALLVRGPFADFLLRRHPFGVMNAMAIGHIVIAEHDGLSSRVLIHELTHVRQAARWGIVFPFAYLASSAWAAMRGKDAYWHNRFEKAARKAEKHL